MKRVKIYLGILALVVARGVSNTFRNDRVETLLPSAVKVASLLRCFAESSSGKGTEKGWVGGSIPISFQRIL